MRLRGVPINELFASLAFADVPDSELHGEMPHQQLDPKSIRALGGARIADQILRLVPDIKTFKQSFKTIVVWAILNGIYSKSAGFLGGVSWGLLVARICQMYPDAPMAVLVHKFFFVYSNGKWPQPDPNNLGMLVWDSTVTDHDQYHLLPVRTPAPPQRNFSFNVTISAKTIILDKLRQGLSITHDILIGNSGWHRLFEEPDFFGSYRHYLVLMATSICDEHQAPWCKVIESRLKHLVIMLEHHRRVTIAHLNPERINSIPLNKNKGHPFVLQFGPLPSKYHVAMPKRTRNNKGRIAANVCTLWFIGLGFETRDGDVDLTSPVAAFLAAVYNLADDTDVLREGMAIKARHTPRSELTRYLHPSLINKKTGFNIPEPEPAPEPPRKRARLSNGRGSSSDANVVGTGKGSKRKAPKRRGRKSNKN